MLVPISIREDKRSNVLGGLILTYAASVETKEGPATKLPAPRFALTHPHLGAEARMVTSEPAASSKSSRP